MAAYQQQGIQVVDNNVHPPAEIRENTTLLVNGTAGGSKWQCCLKSNATLLILVWNLCIAIGLEYFSSFPVIPGLDAWTNIMRVCLFGVSAIFLLFYVLAGYLAEAHWGRYTTILGSLRFFLISAIVIYFLGILGICGSLAVSLTHNDYSYESLYTLKIVSIIILCLVFGLPVLFGTFLIVFSLVAFSANVIQYGIDQLVYDAHSENIILYIYWYVWTCYLAEFIMKIMITLFGIASYLINSFIFLIVLPIIIGITFCIKRCTIHFVNTPPSDNPYKLIYQIIGFTVNHNNSRNLWSNNHNEPLPSSRLDLGKQRYGGPFTSNQIEAVKSFLRILCILLTLGPVLLADLAVSQTLPSLIPHMERYPTYISVIAPNLGDQKYNLLKSLISSGALSPLVIVVALPIYICLLRPCLYIYIPGALKRIGIGMVFIFLSALCTLLIDTFGHIQTANKNVTTCFLNTNYYYDDPYYNIVPY